MMVMEGMLDKKGAEDEDCKVRIQLMEAEVEFQNEGREIMLADNTHELKGASDT